MATPVVPTPPRNLGRDAFFPDEKPRAAKAVLANKFAATTASKDFDNPLEAGVTAGLPLAENIPSGFTGQKGNCSLFLPSGFKGGKVELTVLFCVATEMNRHGLRFFFDGKADRALVTVPGVEAGWDIGGTVAPKAWGIGISKAQIDELFAKAGHAKATWQLSVLAGYSTGYRGVNGTINNAIVPLGDVKRLVYYDCLYRADDPKPPKGKSGGNTQRAIAALQAARGANPFEVIAYRVSTGGTKPEGLAAAPKATVIDLQTPSVALTVLIQARVLSNAVEDGYFPDTKVPAGLRALIGVLPARGTLASSALTKSRASAGTLSEWGKTHQKLVAAAIKESAAAGAIMRADRLMGWEAPDSEIRHDGFIPEFGWELMPA